MTLTLDLSQHAETKLREAAEKLGLDVRDYAAKLLESLAPVSLSETLAPFRKEVAASGMSDAELDTFFKDLIAKVREEKKALPHG